MNIKIKSLSGIKVEKPLVVDKNNEYQERHFNFAAALKESFQKWYDCLNLRYKLETVMHDLNVLGYFPNSMQGSPWAKIPSGVFYIPPTTWEHIADGVWWMDIDPQDTSWEDRRGIYFDQNEETIRIPNGDGSSRVIKL